MPDEQKESATTEQDAAKKRREAITQATDGQLAHSLDNALADLALADKYEHNAHLREPIMEHIDRVMAEQYRRVQQAAPLASASTTALTVREITDEMCIAAARAHYGLVGLAGEDEEWDDDDRRAAIAHYQIVLTAALVALPASAPVPESRYSIVIERAVERLTVLLEDWPLTDELRADLTMVLGHIVTTEKPEESRTPVPERKPEELDDEARDHLETFLMARKATGEGDTLLARLDAYSSGDEVLNARMGDKEFHERWQDAVSAIGRGVNGNPNYDPEIVDVALNALCDAAVRIASPIPSVSGLERAAQVCEEYAKERRALPHIDDVDVHGCYARGQADGAEEALRRIRALPAVPAEDTP